MSKIGTKFEVGKTYECGELRAVCQYSYVSERYNFMVGLVTRAPVDSYYKIGEEYNFRGAEWREYHEPVVTKQNFWLKRGHGIYMSDQEKGHLPDNSFVTLLGEIELTLTDDKLTDVRLL